MSIVWKMKFLPNYPPLTGGKQAMSASGVKRIASAAYWAFTAISSPAMRGFKAGLVWHKADRRSATVAPKGSVIVSLSVPATSRARANNLTWKIKSSATGAGWDATGL
jgi:hypothetical protein